MALPLLTALVAELQLQLKSSAVRFLEHSDVLDFPGARSRHNWTQAAEKLGDAKKLAELILRGKVAFLFERFTAEFALNGLVLCVKPGNQDVRTISDYVTPWIHAVHGREPADRAKSPVALFMTLTFFDERFVEKTGGKNSWHDAIHTSVVDLFGNTSDWVDSWTNDKPFNNVFWGRNPGFIARGLMTYEGSRETGKLDPERIEEFRADYLSTDLVQKHVADAAEAFDRAFDLNDGGVTYLSEKIGAVCKPELKEAQIAVRLAALISDIQSDLAPMYIPDTGTDALLKQRKTVVSSAIKDLGGTLIRNKFGHFLRALTVEHEDIVAALARLPSDDTVETNIARVGKDDLRAVLEGILPDDAVDEDEETDAPETQNGAFAQKAIDTWAARVAKLSSDTAYLQKLGLEREATSEIAHELLKGANAEDLKSRIVEVLDRILLSVDSPTLRGDKVATVSAEVISDYVLHLGQTWKPEAERAKLKRNNKPIFQPEERKQTLRKLIKPKVPRVAQIYGDWCQALMALVEFNVTGGEGNNADSPANRALGEILERIDSETKPT